RHVLHRDVAELRAVATVVLVPRAVEPAEAIGVDVPAQVVAESRAVATVALVVKAEDSAEAIGVVVILAQVMVEPSVAEATVKAMLLTSLRRIEDDAAEKNYYIDSSSTPCSKVGLPHLAADGVRRTPCWIRHAIKAGNIRVHWAKAILRHNNAYLHR
ncbi:MAG: hypothetical protein U9Q07_07375, partial [Planctomycetota bacterium]|nr:hypothetical protein [Planctomycetota bacterium]